MTQADKELPLLTTVDDATYDELTTLIGQRIVHIALWEDSLADALAQHAVAPDQQTTFDLDLYLEDGAYFELYGVACFDDPEAEAWRGLTQTGARLAALVAGRAQLSDVAVDDDDGLVLVVSAPDGRISYLVVGAWLLTEWDELPDA
ncbi:MAG TPA: hypothetical protein DCL15_11725 [Chloroflexi bacterium]|nr:hypothetical protein [Chloroflexota bacterium]HHW87574.1 hypothetical protein [Chloroflexota bacterium]